MKLAGFEFNYINGDVQYLFKRDVPNADGHIDHVGVIHAGNENALEAGVTYSQDSFDAASPEYLNAPFPLDFKQVIKALWARQEIKDIIAFRIAENERIEAERVEAERVEAERVAEEARIAEEERLASEASRKKEIDDAVTAAVTKALKKEKK